MSAPASGPRRVLLAILGVLLCTAACSDGGASRPRRVLLVVIDSTHAAHLSCHGGPAGLTPHIDALAARGRRFARAVSNSTWTLPSTVSLFTGQLQESHGIVTNQHAVDDSLTLLPEDFRDAGWLTAGFVQMIYASSVHGLDQGFDHYRYYTMTAGPHPDTLFAEAERWMRDHADRPYFAYVHLRRPHSPYDPSPLHLAPLAPGAPFGSHPRDTDLAHADSRLTDGADAEERARVETLYRANLATVDDQLAEILRRAAADPEMLVVLTSDHGEALGEHGHFGHGYHLDPENLHIPLLFAGPGVEPGVDDGSACTVDVAPTLLDAVGLPRPRPMRDGVSLVDRLAGRGPGHSRPIPLSARYNVGSTPRQGVLHGDVSLVLEADGSEVVRRWRWEPAGDGGPVHDASGAGTADADILRRLRDLAQERRLMGRDLAEHGRRDVPAREAELRALGYVR